MNFFNHSDHVIKEEEFRKDIFIELYYMHNKEVNGVTDDSEWYCFASVCICKTKRNFNHFVSCYKKKSFVKIYFY